ncbi:hypothetical protein U0070_012656 [Myodes glareolus]|uniref:peptidylprolyl isomerase n=1 Tax=Myodes glareolus TaxID=447135 RepID=A0AAW0JQZ1_MYOGA
MGGSTRGPGAGSEVLGQSPYERLSLRMLDISGDRGVLKDIIREGAGDPVTPDASVLVKYSGYLEHMDKPFDSNYFRKAPRLMKLGEDITLWGMELGLLSMRRGELARFLFKPTYAYGTLGCPPLIPPNATVLFEIELIDFLDSAESDKFCALSAEQQEQFPLQKVLKALLLLHRRLAICEEQHLVEPAELLACLLLTEYEQARDFLVRAQKEQPCNHDINNELKKLSSHYRDYVDREKEMCHRMFAPCGGGSSVGGN